jgi:hypothetical protein
MLAATGVILKRDHGGVNLHPIGHDVIALYGYRIWPDGALACDERSALRALGSRGATGYYREGDTESGG